ncbi:MAG: hypothetical protein KME17_12545 [Cyanosarcina radialis HA8281-LM2]|jgi:hypothetical protein|nr:hypothetical protein [Cyanosarcina radialis HA8281-LM2]
MSIHASPWGEGCSLEIASLEGEAKLKSFPSPMGEGCPLGRGEGKPGFAKRIWY